VVGGLFFGNRAQETVILNHMALRVPAVPRDRELMPLAHLLPQVRALMAAGKPDEAEKLWHRAAQEAGYHYVYSDPCHPAARIDFVPTAGGVFARYERYVDCATGRVGNYWKEAAALFERQAFAPRGTNLVVLQLRGNINGRISLSPVDTAQATVWRGTTYPTIDAAGWAGTVTPVEELVAFEMGQRDDVLTVCGRYKYGGGFAVAARVIVKGEGAKFDSATMQVHHANEVDIVCAVGAEPDTELLMAATRAADLERLLAAHTKAHQELFDRATFSLEAKDERSAEELLLACDQDAVPAALVEQMWAYGRYLFISATAEEGALPPHLQGLWAGDWRPPWFGNYTLDENMQMIHWQAEPTGLGELTGPLRRFVAASLPGWKKNARDLFGCEGAVAPLMQGDTRGHADCAEWHFWLSGAGWLAQHVFDHYLFTRDRAFLQREVLPLLREIAAFYESYGVADEGGVLHFVPSISVENKPLGWDSRWAVDATMDVAVAREVLGNLLWALREVGGSAEEIARVKALREKMPAYRVNADGALAEWLDVRMRDHYQHRHLSHLYPLFPGFEISVKMEVLYAAAKRAIELRQTAGLQSQTGWSWAHLSHIHARLEEGDAAARCLERILRSCTQNNLLTTHNDWRASGLTMGQRGVSGAFQIDANMGFTSAVVEMLVRSTPEEIVVLGALPKAWPCGRIGPIWTRLGPSVTVAWENGRGTCVVRGRGCAAALVRFGPRVIAERKVRGAEVVFELVINT